MANIFVGFHDRKSSSRILKPPGGGTSDIFNTSVTEKKSDSNNVKRTPPEATPDITPTTTPTKEEVPCPLNGSAIVEKDIQENCNKNDTSPETPKMEALNISEESQRQESQEKKGDEIQCSVEVKETKTETISSLIHENQHKEVKVTTPEKKVNQRVPPGGYSSGLW